MFAILSPSEKIKEFLPIIPVYLIIFEVIFTMNYTIIFNSSCSYFYRFFSLIFFQPLAIMTIVTHIKCMFTSPGYVPIPFKPIVPNSSNYNVNSREYCKKSCRHRMIIFIRKYFSAKKRQRRRSVLSFLFLACPQKIRRHEDGTFSGFVHVSRSFLYAGFRQVSSCFADSDLYVLRLSDSRIYLTAWPLFSLLQHAPSRLFRASFPEPSLSHGFASIGFYQCGF